LTHINRQSDAMFQHTLADSIRLSGVGLHSGNTIHMTLRPAAPETGIVFIRTDRPAGEAVMEASWDRVSDTRMCTDIANDAGVSVGTIEHLMAALSGMGVDNAEIHLSGDEVAIMDGSAAEFVDAILTAGRKPQAAMRQVIRVLKPIAITEGNKTARLEPAAHAAFGFHIDFPSAAIGRQDRTAVMSSHNFRHDISRARTFGFLHEVEAMRQMGLARGGSLDNAVVIDGDRVVNDSGLRFSDEFVRHKILDAVGDLYLAGARIIGHYHGERAGHALNNRLLHALFAQPDAWCYDLAGSSRLPACAALSAVA
jgi:UDP-3-O-[3-hydroxymyristoyl] N-acetylglucosamine deacetylase